MVPTRAKDNGHLNGTYYTTRYKQHSTLNRLNSIRRVRTFEESK